MEEFGVFAAYTRTLLPRITAQEDQLLFEAKLVRANDLRSVEDAYSLEKIQERLYNMKRISGLQKVVRSAAT